MKKKDFNIDEILESVDFISKVKDNKKYNKRKTIDTHKQISNQKIETSLNRDVEQIIIDAELANDNKKKDNQFSETLILNNLTSEETTRIVKNTLFSNSTKPLILSNEFKEVNAETQKLKNISLQQNEKIKDLNILLDKFKSQKRYSSLDKVIKLYQEDNAILRKKILRLENLETTLRLKLAEAKQNKNIKKR